MDESIPGCGGGRVLNFRATELRLGPPGSDSPERDLFFPVSREGGGGPARPVKRLVDGENSGSRSPASSKTQVVGWPPIRSFRKNTMASHPTRADNDIEIMAGSGCLFVKVGMDGAPYLRKVHLTAYASYSELSAALENMFSWFPIGQCSSDGVPDQDPLSVSRLMNLQNGSEYVLTYEDKDGDWMLVGDVPWKMFTETCRRLRIMKSSEATGLAPRATDKQLQL